MPATPTVFISYSHRDEAWKDRLVPQLRALEQAGVDCRCGTIGRSTAASNGIPKSRRRWQRRGRPCCSSLPDFLASEFCVQEEVPALLKGQEERDVADSRAAEPCVWKAHRWLKDARCFRATANGSDRFPNDHADVVFLVAERCRAFRATGPEAPPALPGRRRSKAGADGSLSDLAVIPPARAS